MNPQDNNEASFKFSSGIGVKFQGAKGLNKTFERAVKSLLKERSERVKCDIENRNYDKKWGLYDPKGNEILYKDQEVSQSPTKFNLSPTSFVEMTLNDILNPEEESKVESFNSSKNVSDSEESEEDDSIESVKKSKKGLRVSYYDEVYKEEIERGEMDKENLKHARAKSVGGEVRSRKSILKNKNLNEEKEKRNVENIEKIAKEIGPIDDDKLTKLISLQKEEVLELPNEELKMILKYFGIHAFVSIYQADQKFIDDISEKLSKDNTAKVEEDIKKNSSGEKKSKEEIEKEKKRTRRERKKEKENKEKMR